MKIAKSLKTILFMKTSRSTVTKQSKQGASKKPRPEIRDDMDSRSGKTPEKKGASKGGTKKKSK